MTDETARQALLEAAQMLDNLDARLAAMTDRLAALQETATRAHQRLAEIEARMHNDGK